MRRAALFGAARARVCERGVWTGRVHRCTDRRHRREKGL